MIKNMNSKMTTNSQLPTTEPKQKTKQKQTKQTTRTGTESQKWRSYGGLSVGRRREEMWRKVQGIRSIIGRYKIDMGRLRIVWEMEKPKNLYAQPMDMNKEGDCCMEGEGMEEKVQGININGR